MTPPRQSTAGVGPAAERPWTDRRRPDDERIELLLAAMTLEEKVAQLGSAWKDVAVTGIGGDGADFSVAPQQDAFTASSSYDVAHRHGLGHLTRPFGTAPVEPADGAARVAEMQQDLLDTTRLGVPAIVHEECLTGFTTYRATVFPTPLAWAATFDPVLVEEMAAAIGADMRAAGVHQGLAPVLDVVRDHRWGRVEETLGEDPHLVGELASAYVRGLQGSGILATLKHFAGYSASQAARNHAPVHMGPRELRDVVLVPFEMAVRDGAASVMNSYSEIDGQPAAASRFLLTDVLRDEWGFDGTVVSDYWAIAFLETMHRVAADAGDAGVLALAAGIDIELPETRCFGDHLVERVRAGSAPVAMVDRSVRRVLRQKLRLGLLDADWTPASDIEPRSLDLDSPRNRTIAARLAEESIVLLSNPGDVLPLDADVVDVALIGPCADDVRTFFGCYSFPNHVLPSHPEVQPGVAALSLRDALVTELPRATVTHRVGCTVNGSDTTAIGDAAAAAAGASVAIVAVGDRSGMFGGGTSGEGCDVPDLSLPGVQGELVEAVLATGTPTVLVVVSGRPYALGPYTDRAAAIVQAFFPGEEGGPALAGVLSGRLVSGGRLPVEIPTGTGTNPSTYLRPPLAGPSHSISNLDPTPAFPFGHGLSYTRFRYSDLATDRPEIDTGGEVAVTCSVTNVGDRSGTEVVQLYYDDPVAQVTRPTIQLLGFARVTLEPHETAVVRFSVHTDRFSFTGTDLQRIVEPGDITLSVGPSSADLPLSTVVTLTGAQRVVTGPRVLRTPTTTRR